MDLITSRTFGDCTICCVAMITGQTYDTIMGNALEYMLEYQGFKFLPQRVAYKLLIDYNKVPGAIVIPEPNEPVNLNEGDELIVMFSYTQPALVTVPGNAGMLHAVVWDGERRAYLDPNYSEPISAQVYEDSIIEWCPITDITCQHKATWDHQAKLSRCIICKEVIAVKVGQHYTFPNDLKIGDTIEIEKETDK